MFLLLALLPLALFSQTKTRIIEGLGFDWKFLLADSANAAAAKYNDASWEYVQVPHDWSI